MKAIVEQIESEFDEQIITHASECLKYAGAETNACYNVTVMRVTIAYLLGQAAAQFALDSTGEDANATVLWLSVTHDRNIVKLWEKLLHKPT